MFSALFLGKNKGRSQNKKRKADCRTMSSNVTVYVARASAPCRAVLLLLKDLGIQHTVVEVDLSKGEHLKKEFLELNPNHTVPTLEVKWDAESETAEAKTFSLWESRAILMYLATNAPRPTALLPDNGEQQAHILRWMYWDLGTLYAAIGAYVYPPIFAGADPCNLTAEYKKLVGVLDDFNNMLENKKFLMSTTAAAEEKPTLADLSVAMSLTMLDFVPAVLEGKKNILGWQQNIKKYFGSNWAEINEPFKAWVDHFSSTNRCFFSSTQ